jgi:hypothetical protein
MLNGGRSDPTNSIFRPCRMVPNSQIAKQIFGTIEALPPVIRDG